MRTKADPFDCLERATARAGGCEDGIRRLDVCSVTPRLDRPVSVPDGKLWEVGGEASLIRICVGFCQRPLPLPFRQDRSVISGRLHLVRSVWLDLGLQRPESWQ